jgi:hypothetical protein
VHELADRLRIDRGEIVSGIGGEMSLLADRSAGAAGEEGGGGVTTVAGGTTRRPAARRAAA